MFGIEIMGILQLKAFQILTRLDLLLMEDPHLAILFLLEVILFQGEVRSNMLLFDPVLNMNIKQ